MEKKRVLSKIIFNIEDYIGGILMVGITALAFMQVIFRTLKLPLAWTEEYVVYLFIWMIYLGASSCTKNRSHLRIDMLYDVFPKKAQKVVNLFDDLLWLLFAIILMKYNSDVTKQVFERGVRTIAAKIPAWIGYSSVMFGMLLMSIRLAINIIEDFKAFGKGKEGTQ